MLRNSLILMILTCVFALHAQAQSVSIYSLTTMRRLQNNITRYPNDLDLARRLTQAMGIKVTTVSTEWYIMKSGALVIEHDPESLDHNSAQVLELSAQSAQRQLEVNEFKGPHWIHMLKPIDNEEEACLWLVQRNGRSVGCGDVWQGGLTNDEVTCVGDKTYLKCQLDCIKRIYNRTNEIDDRPGFCPAVTP